jgi:hypothetical protein
VARVLQHRYGDELELVDAWDLIRVRTDAGVDPIAIRVRFVRTHRPGRERTNILRACESFLNQYLGATAAGGFRLVDVDAEEVA